MKKVIFDSLVMPSPIRENNPFNFSDPTGLYVEYGPNGRIEYFTRDSPVMQKQLDSKYGFSPTTNSCKTASIFNSYLAETGSRITKEQLDQLFSKDNGTNINIAKDGSPLLADEFSKDVARVLGKQKYNSLSKNSRIDKSIPAIVRTESAVSPHYVFRDSEGTIDSLYPNRPSAKNYKDINQQSIQQTYLPEFSVWLNSIYVQNFGAW